MGRDIIVSMTAIALIVFGGWLHHIIGTARHDAHTQTAINNAVSVALDNNRPTMTCKEQSLIDSIKGMSDNGIHMDTYRLYINIGNAPEWEAWE